MKRELPARPEEGEVRELKKGSLTVQDTINCSIKQTVNMIEKKAIALVY